MSRVAPEQTISVPGLTMESNGAIASAPQINEVVDLVQVTDEVGISSQSTNTVDQRYFVDTDKKHTIKLGFNNLSVVSSGRFLLNSVTGYIPQHGITAVIGPSASGKSVLLRTLSGRLGEISNANMFGSIIYKG